MRHAKHPFSVTTILINLNRSYKNVKSERDLNSSKWKESLILKKGKTHKTKLKNSFLFLFVFLVVGHSSEKRVNVVCVENLYRGFQLASDEAQVLSCCTR
jgi:hypothetical protein